jgi:hypothetical protein
MSMRNLADSLVMTASPDLPHPDYEYVSDMSTRDQIELALSFQAFGAPPGDGIHSRTTYAVRELANASSLSPGLWGALQAHLTTFIVHEMRQLH